jgi:hypothetical protein
VKCRRYWWKAARLGDDEPRQSRLQSNKAPRCELGATLRSCLNPPACELQPMEYLRNAKERSCWNISSDILYYGGSFSVNPNVGFSFHSSKAVEKATSFVKTYKC